MSTAAATVTSPSAATAAGAVDTTVTTIFVNATSSAATTAGPLATTSTTSYATPTFGAKDDTVWFGFLGIVILVAVFIVTLTLVFIIKTCYNPENPLQKQETQKALGQRRRKKLREQRKKKKQGDIESQRETKSDTSFQVSELGSISESNSEESAEENRVKAHVTSDTKTDPQQVSIELVNLDTSEDDRTEEPAASLDIPFDQITCGRRIGKGGVGSVYAGELMGVGPVALKKVSVAGDERLDNLAQEASMMAALRHPHIVHLYGLTTAPEEESANGSIDRWAYLVMELCSADVGSLIDNSPKMKQQEDSDQPVGDNTVFYADRVAIMQKIAQQVARTMQFVHSQNVVHRDLKPANILLKENNDIRIADFGLSKALSTDQHHQTMEIGTPAYMAPELIVGIQDDDEAVIKVPKKLDVYAFGILLWSLFMDLHPYPNLGAFQTIYQVKMMNLRPKIPPSTSVAMRSLLQKCWAQDPEERPSFADINEALDDLIDGGDWVSQDGGAKIFVD